MTGSYYSDRDIDHSIDPQEEDYTTESEYSDPEVADVSVSSLSFLSECAANADHLLKQIGLEPCAQTWTKPEFKDQRREIMFKLVALRDQSEEMMKITGDIAFFLNAPFLFSKSKDLKDPKSSDWNNAIITTFNTFYMECTKQWPRYDPSISVYTSYMSQLKHKVRYNSKDEPEVYDANRLFQFKKLSDFERGILDREGTEGMTLDELKMKLHIKSGYSMTVIDNYFVWKVQKNPAPIDADNSPVSNIPLSPEQKIGKSHLRSPEEAFMDNEVVRRFKDRVDQMIEEQVFEGQGDPETIRDFIYNLSFSGQRPSKLAKDMGLNSWEGLRDRLSKDPVICSILGTTKARRKRAKTFTIQETARMDVQFTEYQEDEQVENFDFKKMANRHNLDQ